ncbi:hypothetical protein MMC06_003002 [Schaereria dolodes]|nr:hypothetical protein [Schaereria dolodes]
MSIPAPSRVIVIGNPLIDPTSKVIELRNSKHLELHAHLAARGIAPSYLAVIDAHIRLLIRDGYDSLFDSTSGARSRYQELAVYQSGSPLEMYKHAVSTTKTLAHYIDGWIPGKLDVYYASVVAEQSSISGRLKVCIVNGRSSLFSEENVLMLPDSNVYIQMLAGSRDAELVAFMANNGLHSSVLKAVDVAVEHLADCVRKGRPASMRCMQLLAYALKATPIDLLKFYQYYFLRPGLCARLDQPIKCSNLTDDSTVLGGINVKDIADMKDSITENTYRPAPTSKTTGYKLVEGKEKHDKTIIIIEDSDDEMADYTAQGDTSANDFEAESMDQAVMSKTLSSRPFADATLARGAQLTTRRNSKLRARMERAFRAQDEKRSLETARKRRIALAASPGAVTTDPEISATPATQSNSDEKVSRSELVRTVNPLLIASSMVGTGEQRDTRSGNPATGNKLIGVLHTNAPIKVNSPASKSIRLSGLSSSMVTTGSRNDIVMEAQRMQKNTTSFQLAPAEANSNTVITRSITHEMNVKLQGQQGAGDPFFEYLSGRYSVPDQVSQIGKHLLLSQEEGGKSTIPSSRRRSRRRVRTIDKKIQKAKDLRDVYQNRIKTLLTQIADIKNRRSLHLLRLPDDQEYFSAQLPKRERELALLRMNIDLADGKVHLTKIEEMTARLGKKPSREQRKRDKGIEVLTRGLARLETN